MSIPLGARVRHAITAVEGTVIARQEELDRGTTVLVQPMGIGEDGGPLVSTWFPEAQVVQ